MQIHLDDLLCLIIYYILYSYSNKCKYYIGISTMYHDVEWCKEYCTIPTLYTFWEEVLHIILFNVTKNSTSSQDIASWRFFFHLCHLYFSLHWFYCSECSYQYHNVTVSYTRKYLSDQGQQNRQTDRQTYTCNTVSIKEVISLSNQTLLGFSCDLFGAKTTNQTNNQTNKQTTTTTTTTRKHLTK